MSLEYDPQGVLLEVRNARHISGLSFVLGFGPMRPFLFGAVGAWVLTARPAQLVIVLTLTWDGAVLAFLAGVQRGLSFRTPGGAQPAQITTMVGLSTLAVVALAVPSLVLRAALLAIGLSAVVVLDLVAVHGQETPPFFARLRPAQMPIAIASLIAILVHL
jgi:hypothetical protein